MKPQNAKKPLDKVQTLAAAPTLSAPSNGGRQTVKTLSSSVRKAQAENGKPIVVPAVSVWEKLKSFSQAVKRNGSLKSHLDAVTACAVAAGMPDYSLLVSAREKILSDAGRKFSGIHSAKGIASYKLARAIGDLLADDAKGDEAKKPLSAAWKRAQSLFQLVADDQKLDGIASE